MKTRWHRHCGPQLAIILLVYSTFVGSRCHDCSGTRNNEPVPLSVCRCQSSLHDKLNHLSKKYQDVHVPAFALAGIRGSPAGTTGTGGGSHLSARCRLFAGDTAPDSFREYVPAHDAHAHSKAWILTVSCMDLFRHTVATRTCLWHKGHAASELPHSRFRSSHS
jgi:hypothetical protein